MTAMANIRQTFMENWQNWQTAMANSYGKTAKERNNKANYRSLP
jgi:hypothetical protein